MDCINQPTEELMQALEELVRNKEPFKSNPEIAQALKGLRNSLSEFPSILSYIQGLNRKTAIGVKQLQFLMMAVIFRSSSTYATIPNLITCLNLMAEYEWASVINKNLNEEVGNGMAKSHPILLFENFRIIGETFNLAYLNPASYSIVNILHQSKLRVDQQINFQPELFHVYVDKHNLYVPEYCADDLKAALYYYRLGGKEIISYHQYVVDHLLGPFKANRSSMDLCIQALELAVREASSVDEHNTGKLSFIGAYETIVHALIDKIPEDKKDSAIEWFRVHNDAHLGQKAGWSESAEEGHAEDARNLALYLLNRINAESFLKIISAVNKICESRFNYWDDIVKQLQSFTQDDEYLELSAPQLFSLR